MDKKLSFREMLLIFITIVLSSCFLISGISNAEENALTIEECLQLALKNNQELEISKEKLNTAKYSKIRALGGFLPSLSLTSSIELGGKESILWRLSLNQPLYTGGKIRNSFKQAEYNYEIAKEEYRKIKNELIFKVKKAFYSVILAEEFVKIAKEAEEVMQKHLEVTKALYKEGKVSGYDVSKVKVQLVNSQTNLIKSKNSLELAKKFLFNLLNQKGIEDRYVTGRIDVEIIQLKDLEYYTRQAIENRPEIPQLEYQEKISKSLVSLAVAENLPNISLVGNYDYQRPYYVHKWTGALSGMVILNFPILDGFGISNYGKIKKAKSIEKQIKITKNQLEEGIKLEVEKVYLNLIELAERISALKENVEIAKENLRIAQKRYRLGLLPDIEVRDTQLALTQAEVNYSQALYDYKIALEELNKITGGITE